MGRIQNLDELAAEAFRGRTTHFSEMGGGGINPTELVATLINRENSFAEGIRCAQEAIEGSCSLLLLTDDAIYAARDRLGRTPVVIGRKPGAYRRHPGDLRLAEPGLRGRALPGPGRDRAGSRPTASRR